MKPAVSAGSRDTNRYHAGDHDELAVGPRRRPARRRSHRDGAALPRPGRHLRRDRAVLLRRRVQPRDPEGSAARLSAMEPVAGAYKRGDDRAARAARRPSGRPPSRCSTRCRRWRRPAATTCSTPGSTWCPAPTGRPTLLELELTEPSMFLDPRRHRRYRVGRPVRRGHRRPALWMIDAAAGARHRDLLRRDRGRPGPRPARCSPTRSPPASRSTRGSAAWCPRSPAGRTSRRWCRPSSGPAQTQACGSATSTRSRSPAVPASPVPCSSASPLPRRWRSGSASRCTASTTSPRTSRSTSSSTARCPRRASRCWCRAATPRCCWCDDVTGDVRCRSGPPSTTRRARRSTRWRGCSACRSRAVRTSTGPRKDGDPAYVDFPRGLTGPRDLREHRYDFSFSGLKTAVARWVETRERDGEPVPVADVAAAFQEAVVDVLTRKAVLACTEQGVDHLLIGGGVAANSRLRAMAQERCDAAGIRLRVPRPGLCTDNGAMVAALGRRAGGAGRRAVVAGPAGRLVDAGHRRRGPVAPRCSAPAARRCGRAADRRRRAVRRERRRCGPAARRHRHRGRHPARGCRARGAAHRRDRRRAATGPASPSATRSAPTSRCSPRASGWPRWCARWPSGDGSGSTRCWPPSRRRSPCSRCSAARSAGSRAGCSSRRTSAWSRWSGGASASPRPSASWPSSRTSAEHPAAPSRGPAGAGRLAAPRAARRAAHAGGRRPRGARRRAGRGEPRPDRLRGRADGAGAGHHRRAVRPGLRGSPPRRARDRGRRRRRLGGLQRDGHPRRRRAGAAADRRRCRGGRRPGRRAAAGAAGRTRGGRLGRTAGGAARGGLRRRIVVAVLA